MPYSADEIRYREFDLLEPTDKILEYACHDAFGELVRDWVVRLVYVKDSVRPDEPIIEFYDAEDGQFVSDFYVSTWLEQFDDPSWEGHDSPYNTVCLWGTSSAWQISVSDMSDVLAWARDAMYDLR